MYGFIYQTTNLINGKKYIGKRVYDKYGVWRTYLGSGSALKKAIKKYGKDNFEREIICECETEEELNEKEIYYIALFDAARSRDYYNSSTGGEKGGAGVIRSEEERKQIAERVKNSYTDERRQAYSKRMKENNPNADGHVFRGKKLTEEQRKYQSKIHKGRPGLRGEKNPMYGKCGELSPHFDGKTKTAKKVRCLETGKTYNCINSASRDTGLSACQISACCKGVNKTCGGLHWEYVDPNSAGMKMTEEVKKHMSEIKKGSNNPMAKKVICVETGEIYNTIAEVARKYNCSETTISSSCKHITKNNNTGFHWEFFNSDEYQKKMGA